MIGRDVRWVRKGRAQKPAFFVCSLSHTFDKVMGLPGSGVMDDEVDKGENGSLETHLAFLVDFPGKTVLFPK